MPQFILDILTARGWSVRYLSELTGLSYSGVRDFLHGHPNRLSNQRVQRLYEVLDLDRSCGLLQRETVYTWRIEHGFAQLAALDRVLRVMLEIGSHQEWDAGMIGVENAFRFFAVPLLGGGIELLPAPYCVLSWQGITILIQWALPVRQVRKAAGFQSQNTSNNTSQPIYPDLSQLNSAVWAEGVSVSKDRLCGIPLTPSQLNQLKASESSPGSIDIKTLHDWLSINPIEDTHWAHAQLAINEWTWERILQAIQLRYERPEHAAKALKLR